MNSSVLRILAVILAIGAIAVGYMGYRAGKQPLEKPQEQAKIEPKTEAVVLATKEIPSGQSITEQDLTIGQVPTRPEQAYASTRDLIGKKPKITIPSGEMLLSSHFPAHSQLAQTVMSGERAVAVKVDETIGTGGFIEPGDRVDVLLFLRSDRNEVGSHSSAQVILSNVRILAFGNTLEAPVNKEAEQSSEKTELLAKTRTSKSEAKQTDEKPSGKKSKTAVLAVPAEETTKLMLADSSGTIRLALHGVDSEREPDAPLAGPPLATAGLASRSQGSSDLNRAPNYIELRDLISRKSTTVARRHSHGPRAIVHKGGTTETVVLNRSHSPVSLTYSGNINR